MKDDDRYIELLLKEADQMISPAEQQELDEWLARSLQNQQVAEKLRESWRTSSTLIPEINVDLDREFAAVQDKIKHSGRTVKLPFWPVAAVILFLLGSGVVTYYLWNLNPQSDFVLTGPGENLRLEDGSTVWLAADAQLEVRFSEEIRSADFAGKGYFEINPDATRPFVIRTGMGDISVLGTSFEVVADPVQLSVNLSEGEVLLSNQNQQSISLQPGENGIITASRIEKKKSEKPAGSWLLPPVNYEQSELAEILKEIEARYLVRFTVEESDVLRCKVNFVLNYPNLPDLISILETLLEIEISKSGDSQYLITGKGC